MSRPPGSGLSSDADVGREYLRLAGPERRYVTRAEVAEALSISEDGLRKRHRRAQMTWPTYAQFCTRFCPPSVPVRDDWRERA